MPGSQTFDEARRCLHDAAMAAALDQPPALAPLLRGRMALRPQTVDLAADAAVRDAAYENLLHGWTPTEVMAFARRRLAEPGLDYVRDALAATASCTHGTSWLYDLRRVGATVWWSLDRPHLTQWLRKHGLGRPDGLGLAVDVLALLSYLPRTDLPVVETPATPLPEVPSGTLVLDARMRGRIEALLARATASDYDSEAAACARKAQELLRRCAATPTGRTA